MRRRRFLRLAHVTSLILLASSLLALKVRAQDNEPPPGFQKLFNGKDLAGWKVANPNWVVKDGVVTFNGKGSGGITLEKSINKHNVLLIDWMIPAGEKGHQVSGLFFNNCHIKIWNPFLGKGTLGEQDGSGSLGYGPNRVPVLKKTDKAQGQWNHFEIISEAGTVTVKLNGETVVDKAPKSFGKTTNLGLQNHGCAIHFKNIYLKERE